MSKIVIVGAGISGLATAFHAQRLLPEADLTVLEANPRPGGTIWTERRAGFQVEIGANSFLDNRPSTLDLCARLGLADRLLSASPAARHRYLFLRDQLHPLPEGLWSFIRSPLLSWRGKLALLTERWRGRRAGNADESVHNFIARRTSEEVAQVLGDALVTGIHAGDPKLLSMRAAFPRIADMEQRHGSVLAGMGQAARQRRRQAAARQEPYRPGNQLLSFREGLRLLIETLAGRLRKPPLLGVSARRLQRPANGPEPWLVHGDGQDLWRADVVVLACPAHRQAALLDDLDAPLAAEVGAIAYCSAIVVALGFRRADVPASLNGFGYIAPQRTRRDVLGLQYCSSIFSDRAPEGMVLLRAIAGGWRRRDIMAWDDDRLLDAVRAELRLALRVESPPVFHHLVRWEQAIPQYHLGHLDRVQRIDALAARHPGLFLAGNAYHGVALNDCTEQAERVASIIARFVRGRPC